MGRFPRRVAGALVVIAALSLLSQLVGGVAASQTRTFTLREQLSLPQLGQPDENTRRRRLHESTPKAPAQCQHSAWRCPDGELVSDYARTIIAAGPCLSDRVSGSDTVLCGGRIVTSKTIVKYISSQECTAVRHSFLPRTRRAGCLGLSYQTNSLTSEPIHAEPKQVLGAYSSEMFP